MKKEDTTPSAASRETVKGETVSPVADPIQDPTRRPATDPVDREKHDQPPA
jgi:hypothetical protein